MDLVTIADLWEGNQERLKQHLGRSDSNRFGAHWVLTPEAPFPRFNHVSRIRGTEAEATALIAEARTFFRERGMASCCLLVTPATQPADLPDRLYRMGFTSETNPVMIWNGSPVGKIAPQVRVERASAALQPLVFDLIRQVFLPQASQQTLAMGRRGVAVSSNLGAIHYIAYCGNRPAGSGMLYIHRGMGGIYNMCTLPEMRGRGVASAILAACLADAKVAGCTHVGLTPTPMGRPLYERLGFQVAYQERYFIERF